MNSDIELPENVRQAAQANQKIKAIKLLRATNGMGLADAKHAVDKYMADNAALIQPAQSNSSGLVAIILVFAVAYAAYRFFAN